MRPLILLLVLIVLVGAAFLWNRSGGHLLETPRSSLMPPVVDRSMEELLQEFEVQVTRNQPGVAELLRPGITDQQLQEAEAALGAPLHPEIAALYRWHNGMERGLYLFPGYDFYSLEEAIKIRDDSNAYFSQKGMELFMAHEANWLLLFPDPAGDGYYYDFKKNYEDGGVFFVFRESGYYVHFPSLKNLLAGLIECYRQGAYQGSQTLDFGLENQIMESLGRVESK